MPGKSKIDNKCVHVNRLLVVPPLYSSFTSRWQIVLSVDKCRQCSLGVSFPDPSTSQLRMDYITAALE